MSGWSTGRIDLADDHDDTRVGGEGERVWGVMALRGRECAKRERKSQSRLLLEQLRQIGPISLHCFWSNADFSA